MKTKRKGFTLIELLIVIAIIGILAAALLPTILNAPARGRDAARTGNLNSIVAAIEAYNADNGSYPQTSGCVDGSTVFGGDADKYFAGGIPPQDPSGGDATGTTCKAQGYYHYAYIGDGGVEYVLDAVMELEQNNNTADDETAIEGLSESPSFACQTDAGTPCTHFALVK